MRQPPADESVIIDGVRYLTAGAVCRALGLVRQTLWRWRSNGLVPKGSRYRGQQVLFTEDEAAAIRDFANRLEPLEREQPRQRRSSR